MSDLHDSPRAAFDDDRLLDYALGLEDDPELAAALSRSARLRERLADLKADLASIETELRRAIPELDDSYADPGASRWSRLQRSFGVGETGGGRPRRRRRLATVLVAAALALALVIGVLSVLPRSRPGPTGTRRSSESAQAAGSAAGQSSALAGGKTAPVANAGTGAVATSGTGTAGAPSVTALHAAEYRDVAVVRAGVVIGAQQDFGVVRTLKGTPPAAFALTLRSTNSAPATGSLEIAYLRPLAAPSPAASSPVPPDYTYSGRQALLTPLPTGAAASAVRLP
jgi:hypothetical protein